MQYKGFEAHYYYVGNLGLYAGEVVDNENHICFAAKNLTDLAVVMREAVDNYLNEVSTSIDLVEPTT